MEYKTSTPAGEMPTESSEERDGDGCRGVWGAGALGDDANLEIGLARALTAADAFLLLDGPGVCIR